MSLDPIHWRTSEARILAELYPQGGAVEVVKALPNRSAAGVREAARRMGIKRMPGWARR